MRRGTTKTPKIFDVRLYDKIPRLVSIRLFSLHVILSGLQVYYYRQPIPPNTNPTQSWMVEGLATWISENAFSNNLDCNTTSNNGAGVGWTGQVAINSFWIQTVANGRRLVLDSFNNSYLGIYTCSDSTTNESVTINITSGKWWVCRSTLIS